VIELSSVTVTYPGQEASHPALREVTFTVEEGELVLVIGPTGSGKSTLLRCVNGLVPHFSGGTMTGSVRVDGRDTRTHRPRDMADVVGLVGQDPLASFVTDTVEDELAYGMETLGVDPSAMRRRVEETLDLLGLAEVRDRTLAELSGGQQQRVAIGAVLTAGPRILVLDEPTSALDPVAAEDVLAALHRLVHDLGVTVLLAEHRLERVVHHADRVLLVDQGTVSAPLEPAEAMARSLVHPPVVELGRRLGWSPLPLSVRDARRRAGDLRARLDAASRDSPASGRYPRTRAATGVMSLGAASSRGRAGLDGASAATVSGLAVRRGVTQALRGVDLGLSRGTVTAVMGRNGAGKSTLLAALAGQVRATSGRVRVGGLDPFATTPARLVREVGLVPQDPDVLLYADRVAAECDQADAERGLPRGSTHRLLDRLTEGVDDDSHPRDLSVGQRLCLALAVILVGHPHVVLLDEPTRGLDYPAKNRLVSVLRDLAAAGHTVSVATHDVELAAVVADRVVVLADGEVVADGAAPDILAGSPAFAPQVAKIFHPLPYLTVADVEAALGEAS
jgi:energy-coupling factor transport system ATP-binding protein